MTELLIAMIAGAFGAAYFVYGRRQKKFAPMFCGIALCVYPYFIDGVAWSCVTGGVLLAIPFFTDL